MRHDLSIQCTARTACQKFASAWVSLPGQAPAVKPFVYIRSGTLARERRPFLTLSASCRRPKQEGVRFIEQGTEPAPAGQETTCPDVGASPSQARLRRR